MKEQRRHLLEYWLNHTFLEGNQWLYVDPHTRSIHHTDADEGRMQATFNRMGAATRSIMSKYTQRELTFEVMPDAATDKAIQGAKTSESVVSGLHQSHDWETKREMLGLAAWKGGTAVMMVDWDPNIGEQLFDAGLSADEEESSRDDVTKEGSTVERPLSIAEFVFQPGAKDPERGDWWIMVQALPPDVVKGTYDLNELPEADARSGLSTYASKLMTVGTMDTDGDLTPLTLVLTYYERPNAANKDGRIAVVVGQKFVDGPKKWPYPWTDRLNIAVHRETPDENKALATTALSQGRPVQTALNALWSNLLEHLKNAGNARLMVDSLSLDLMDTLTDDPGQLLPISDMTKKPEWLQPAPLANWLFQLVQEARQELDDILGNHDVSRGDAPVNIESGYGLSILAEQDASPVTRLVKDSAIVFAKVASMALQLYQANTKASRRTTLQGPNGPRTVQWKGDDLAGQTNVTIPLDGVLPRSRAAMLAAATKAAEMGFIQPGPGSLELFSKMAELPGQSDLIAAANPAVNRARKENFKLGMGRPAVAQVWDDHEAHIREHHAEMMNMDWEDADPKVQEAFLTHLKGHETLAAEAAGQAQQRAQISPLLATAPNASGVPTLPPEALPPGAMDATAAGAAGAPLPEAMQAPPQASAPQPVGGMDEVLSQLTPEQIAALEQQR